MRMVAATILLACLVAVTGVTPALGAQLNALLDPDTDSSEFKMTYQRTAILDYEEGSNISQFLAGKEWIVEGEETMDNPGVQELAASMSNKIRADGSAVSVNDLDVSYNFHLTGRDARTSLDFRVIVQGTLDDYIITKDQLRTLVELGWRGLSSYDSIVVNGLDINIPLNMIQVQDPDMYNLLQGTEAADILTMPLMNADYILEQPLANWHFLFDPTGINVDAGQLGISDELAGKVFSSWTMGESSIREGIQEVREWNAVVSGHSHPNIAGDIHYEFRALQSADQANLDIIGFGTIDKLGDIEIAGVTPRAPDSANTATGDFPVFIIYGMAGLAAVGGGLFFIMSNRALKHEKKGQQGIDPTDLVGYQTSSASGGYQTNRGEAQLRDDSSYQQTRSYYEQVDTAEPEPSRTDAVIAPDATCSCAESESMDSECDCQMQYSCLCDTTCGCSLVVCKDHVSSML